MIYIWKACGPWLKALLHAMLPDSSIDPAKAADGDVQAGLKQVQAQVQALQAELAAVRSEMAALQERVGRAGAQLASPAGGAAAVATPVAEAPLAAAAKEAVDEPPARPQDLPPALFQTPPLPSPANLLPELPQTVTPKPPEVVSLPPPPVLADHPQVHLAQLEGLRQDEPKPAPLSPQDVKIARQEIADPPRDRASDVAVRPGIAHPTAELMAEPGMATLPPPAVVEKVELKPQSPSMNQPVDVAASRVEAGRLAVSTQPATVIWQHYWQHSPE